MSFSEKTPVDKFLKLFWPYLGRREKKVFCNCKQKNFGILDVHIYARYIVNILML